jgi:micrococcal nuclease
MFRSELETAPEPYAYRATVVRVIDGDTLVVHIDQGFHDWKHDQHLRLFGVDAPKLATAAGRAAADYVRRLLPAGAQVVVRPHRDVLGDDVSSFERWVAEVWTPLGDYLPQLLVDAGHGLPWDGRGQHPAPAAEGDHTRKGQR